MERNAKQNNDDRRQQREFENTFAVIRNGFDREADIDRTQKELDQRKDNS